MIFHFVSSVSTSPFRKCEVMKSHALPMCIPQITPTELRYESTHTVEKFIHLSYCRIEWIQLGEIT